MQRRDFLRHAGLAGLGAAVTTPLRAAETPAAVPVGDSPAVYAPTADGATVVLPVADFEAGWVEYGEAGTEGAPGTLVKGDGFGNIPHGDKVLRIRLTGLKPGTDYWYRVHTRAAIAKAVDPKTVPVKTGEVYRFRTLAPEADGTRFCIWNDTHDHPPALARLADMARAEPVDFLFWNGDVSNNVNREALFAGLYLQPRGVNLAKGPAILFTRGNHDVRGAQAYKLPGYIAYPENRPYYSFRTGPVGVIVLDTGEDKPDDHPSFLGRVDFAALIREQAAWLAREIGKPHLKDAPYRVVLCHIPLRWTQETIPDYANGGYDHWSKRGRDAWHASLVKWGAQLVISGHTHRHAHLPATGDFPYDQLVGGGPELERNTTLIRVAADKSALTVRLIAAKSGEVILAREYKPVG